MKEDGPIFIIAPNGSYQNRGCEAIVRGTVKILREHFTNPRFVSLSIFQSEKQYREQCQSETDNDILHLSSRRLDKKEVLEHLWRPKVWTGVFQHIFNRKAMYSWVYGDMLPYLKNASAVLSVGGDNYSLDYGIPAQFTALDDIVYERGKPNILWGASVGPFSALPDYERYMQGHLNRFTGIFARESVTINYLKSIEVTRNVHRVADPAFLMDPVKPDGIDDKMPIPEGAIGINLSPLMAKYVTGGDIDQWTRVAASIIQKVAKTTDTPIYLIPHVTEKDSNDYIFMQRALSEIRENKEKIILVPPIYNAAQIKWIIGRMKLFAGARTHSTIAALSSGIPTLSFAYSIKAQGINGDIFGHTDYCINPKDLEAKVACDHITSMLDREASIRRELSERIPVIKKSSSDAGMILKQILGGN